MIEKNLPDLIREIEEQGIIGSLGEGISIQDTDYRILLQNEIHRDLIGDHRGEFCYKAYEKRGEPCDGCPLTATFQDGGIHTAERTAVTHRGTEQFLITTSPIRNTAGKVIAGVEIVRNVTHRREAERELMESENRYRSLVESTDDSIYLVDRDYKYVYMNKKHLSRLGLLGDQFMEQHYSHFHSPAETRAFIEKVDYILRSGESVQYEYKSVRDGKYFLQTFSPVRNSDGDITAITVISKEITGLKRMEEKLRTLSFTDELTGLYNRRGFFALAEQQLKLAQREQRGRFLLSADMDDLKKINDSLGHKEGDLALLETAIILRKSFRDSDIIARIGGDEFVILASETHEASMENLSARLRENLEAHSAKSNKPYTLSLSFGFSHYEPKSSLSVDELLSRADSRMYEQKKKKNSP